MKHKVVVLTTLVVAAASLQAQDFDALPHAVTLQYRSPEQIAAAVRKTAQDKMYTPEETNQMLAKIAPGGVLDVTLYDQSIGSANPKFLTYTVMDSAGKGSVTNSRQKPCSRDKTWMAVGGMVPLV